MCHKPLKDKATFFRQFLGEPDEDEEWQMFVHPNLVPWLKTFSDSKRIYFVMPLATVGSLHDLVFDPHATLTEMQLRHLLKQIISACTYLKDLGFSHGDLKLPNFLIFDKLLLKLSDFGCLVHWSVNRDRVFPLGTQLPPEILNGQYHTEKADVYAIGICTIALCGKVVNKSGLTFRTDIFWLTSLNNL